MTFLYDMTCHTLDGHNSEHQNKKATHLTLLIVHPNDRLRRCRMFLLGPLVMLSKISLGRRLTLAPFRDAVVLFTLLPALGRTLCLRIRGVVPLGPIDGVILRRGTLPFLKRVILDSGVDVVTLETGAHAGRRGDGGRLQDRLNRAEVRPRRARS